MAACCIRDVTVTTLAGNNVELHMEMSYVEVVGVGRGCVNSG
jgi:hypothetical protein